MTRRVPDAVKRQRGTYRPDRSSAPEFEPSPPPIMPAWLPDHAARYWRLKSGALAQDGLLTPMSAELFASWCLVAAAIEQLAVAGKVPGRDLLGNFRALSKSFLIDPVERAAVLGERPNAKKPTSTFQDVM